MAPTEASVTKKPDPVPVPAKQEEIDDMVEGTRSITQEIDYTKKDAARPIVVNTDEQSNLRAKVLRNLECVRAGKGILSEKSLYQSSIASTNARLDRNRAIKSECLD